jgi:hypothetical protein
LLAFILEHLVLVTIIQLRIAIRCNEKIDGEKKEKMFLSFHMIDNNFYNLTNSLLFLHAIQSPAL